MPKRPALVTLASRMGRPPIPTRAHAPLPAARAKPAFNQPAAPHMNKPRPAAPSKPVPPTVGKPHSRVPPRSLSAQLKPLALHSVLPPTRAPAGKKRRSR